MVRQFFGDWATEEPMRMRIERVGDSSAARRRLTPDALDRRARRNHRLADRRHEPLGRLDRLLPRPSERVRHRHAGMDGRRRAERARAAPPLLLLAGATRRGARHPRHAAATASYWNFELGNYWMNSADYRYRLSSLNSEQAVVEDDGSVVIVVAHRDPGVPNWLDTAGHTVGLMPQRWVEADSSPTPSATLVHVRRPRPRTRRRRPADHRRGAPRTVAVAQDRRRPTVPDVTEYRSWKP